jgi:2OG-Fe(II) oxygenase superfamily
MYCVWSEWIRDSPSIGCKCAKRFVCGGRTSVSITVVAEGAMKSSEVGDDNTGGLYIESRNGEFVHVKIPTDCCAFQIGETSQIMSGGKLQATPHAVLPPMSSAYIA